MKKYILMSTLAFGLSPITDAVAVRSGGCGPDESRPDVAVIWMGGESMPSEFYEAARSPNPDFVPYLQFYDVRASDSQEAIDGLRDIDRLGGVIAVVPEESQADIAEKLHELSDGDFPVAIVPKWHDDKQWSETVTIVDDVDQEQTAGKAMKHLMHWWDE